MGDEEIITFLSISNDSKKLMLSSDKYLYYWDLDPETLDIKKDSKQPNKF